MNRRVLDGNAAEDAENSQCARCKEAAKIYVNLLRTCHAQLNRITQTSRKEQIY